MAREIKPSEEYLGKLLKLIPSEVVAVYMAIQGFIPEENAKWGLTIVSLLLFIITPLYMRYTQRVTRSTQIVISTLSFVVWLYALGGPFTLWNVQQPWIASALLVLWTTFVPQFFPTTSTNETNPTTSGNQSGNQG